MPEEKTWNELLKEHIDKNYSGSLSAFSKKFKEQTGVILPSSTLYDYTNGKIKKISRQNVISALSSFTTIDGIKEAYGEKTTVRNHTPNTREESFVKISELEQLTTAVYKLNQAVMLKCTGKAGYEPSIEERVEILTNLINAAIDQVTGLSKDYRGNRENAEKLTKMVKRGLREEDTGYLISALHAIFDEDKFKSWVLMAEYAPRRKR